MSHDTQRVGHASSAAAFAALRAMSRTRFARRLGIGLDKPKEGVGIAP